ncbi:hypothetical protein CKA32_005861 [Geitlerinema sp. FC II]|nr:hypothetical protein CKA32_005861 [Geitlerinema sp. FC II]
MAIALDGVFFVVRPNEIGSQLQPMHGLGSGQDIGFQDLGRVIN